jgi:basic amino acid/polyamine antiporter, APA family
MNFNQLFRKKNIHDAINGPDFEGGGSGMKRELGVIDLTAFGIAAIIGAGIFSTIGKASFNGGPGVIFLFIFTAFACGFAALAYAEFASLIPVSGSAYTYSYVAFGEIVAWIIGWALLMEYAVGNITVAVSWSGYFTSLVENIFRTDIPDWATIDYPTAKGAAADGFAAVANNSTVSMLQQEAMNAWNQAPQLAGMRIIADFPAILMCILITWLVYVGISESRKASNLMVALKLLIVFAVIVVGACYVDTANWHPFVPNGPSGILAGVSSVFFAYIGFDAISTTAEECKNPQRDLPKAMIYSIIICTVLYIVLALILTGMVSYTELNVDDPLAFVFEKIGLKWFSGVIAVSAVIAMAGVFLVFQLGQPRIWMVMSRDGLLPKKFSELHPKHRTPGFATIVTGILVIVPMLLIPSDTVLDLCSMGTLFAFVLVCGGVLRLQTIPDAPRGKFRIPYANAKFIYPVLLLSTIFILQKYAPGMLGSMFTLEGEWWHQIPNWLFVGLCLTMVYLSFKYNLSLIPVLGLVFCFYMMAQIPSKSWLGFFVWLLVGLVIYFGYGVRHSRLAKA